MRSTESEIQRSILDYLDIRKKKMGYMFWRANTVGIYDPTTKGFRTMPKYSMSGTPDINLIWNGQYIGLEVKREKTKQSENQKEFEKQSKEAGAEYYVVRGIDDIIQIGL